MTKGDKIPFGFTLKCREMSPFVAYSKEARLVFPTRQDSLGHSANSLTRYDPEAPAWVIMAVLRPADFRG